jgi:uncharacterized protein
MEASSVALEADSLTASGVAIGTETFPYELRYELTAANGFVTRSLTVATGGDGWRRRVELTHDGSGRWTIIAEGEGGRHLPAAGGSPTALKGALDCDLGGSPLTNTLPVLRRGLLDGGEAVDVDTAWVSVPDLEIHRSEQRYRFVEARRGGTVIRLELRDGTFAADLEVDADGFVVRYPGLATLIG